MLNTEDMLPDRKNTVIKAAREQTYDVSALLHTGSPDAPELAAPASTAAASRSCQHGSYKSRHYPAGFRFTSHCEQERGMMLAGQQQGDRCLWQEGAAVVSWLGKPCSDPDWLRRTVTPIP